MADSDGEYVADSDDEIGAHQIDGAARGGHGTRSLGPARGGAQGAVGSGTRGGDGAGAGSSRRKAAWEDIQRSWDTVVEGADGSINYAVDGLREASKRQRYNSRFHPDVDQRSLSRNFLVLPI